MIYELLIPLLSNFRLASSCVLLLNAYHPVLIKFGVLVVTAYGALLEHCLEILLLQHQHS